MGLSLTFELRGPEHMTTHHLPHHRRHNYSFPWLLTQTLEDCTKIPPHIPSVQAPAPQRPPALALLCLFSEMGRRGAEGLVLKLCRQPSPPPPLPNRPEQPEEPTWQAEAPLYLSPALTHTQALLGTGPGMSRQDTIVECLPAHLPVLSTPQPHTRQGPGHISGVAKATANAHLLPASHHHHSNSHPGRPRRPECLMLSPDSSRVFPELPWLQHCTRRSHAQPFL